MLPSALKTNPLYSRELNLVSRGLTLKTAAKIFQFPAVENILLVDKSGVSPCRYVDKHHNFSYKDCVRLNQLCQGAQLKPKTAFINCLNCLFDIRPQMCWDVKK